jgi:hypothetical protein
MAQLLRPSIAAGSTAACGRRKRRTRLRVASRVTPASPSRCGRAGGKPRRDGPENCFGPDISESGPIIAVVHTHRWSCSSTQSVGGCSLGCPAEPPPSFHREACSSRVSRPMQSRHKEAEYGSSCGGLRNSCDPCGRSSPVARLPTAHGCSYQARAARARSLALIGAYAVSGRRPGRARVRSTPACPSDVRR